MLGVGASWYKFFQLNVTMYKNAKEESRNGKMRRNSTYLDSEEGHETSTVELLIV